MKRILPFLLSLILLLPGCFDIPENIILPEWDTDFNLPLANRQYNMDEIIKQDKYISIDSTDFLYKINYDTLSKQFGILDFIEDRLNEEQNDVEIPLVQGTGTIELPFSNGIELDTAALSQGKLIVDIFNTSSDQAIIEVTLPAFLEPTGIPLKVRSTIPGNQSVNIERDLTNYTYSGREQTDKNKFKVIGTVIEGNVGDILRVDLKIINTSFSYVSGLLPSLELETIKNTIAMPISADLENFRDKVELSNPVLTVWANYITEVDEILDVYIKNLYIVGRRNDGMSVDLTDKSGNKNLGNIYITGGKLVKVYDNSNSNISDFLEFLPDSIEVKADAVMNPNNQHGAATNKDSIQIGYTLSINSFLKFKDISFKDTSNLEMEKDARESIRDGRKATVYFKIDNRIPMEGTLSVSFADSMSVPYFTKSIDFAGAQIDNNGLAIAPTYSAPEITLDSTEIYQLSKSYKTVMELNFSSSQNQRVALRSTDWIHIISFCSLKYHLHPED